MKLDVELQSTALEGVFKQLMSALDPEEILDEAQTVILNRIRTRFLAEEGPDGKWEPSKAGLRRKAGKYTYRGGKKYTATGTLFETGTLFHSIQAHEGATGERLFSTDVPYAKYLKDKWPFLGFNNEDVDVVVQLIRLRIKEALS